MLVHYVQKVQEVKWRGGREHTHTYPHLPTQKERVKTEAIPTGAAGCIEQAIKELFGLKVVVVFLLVGTEVHRVANTQLEVMRIKQLWSHMVMQSFYHC